MRPTIRLLAVAALFFGLVIPAGASVPFRPIESNTYGSVETIPNPAVIDTGALRAQDLDVQQAFARGVFGCGIVDQVIDVLTSTGAVTTISSLNTHFEVSAGGFNGSTRPALRSPSLTAAPTRRACLTSGC
jgi:hypothetical protein